MANYGKFTNRWLFPDGTGLVTEDLINVGVMASQRAWEVPGMADLLAYDLINGAADYAAALGSTTSPARKSGVFCRGLGLRTASYSAANNIGLTAGFAGIYDDANAGPEQSTDTVPRMSWIWLGDGEWQHAHLAAGTGTSRYDLVHCALVRGENKTARDFEDATTGVKTSVPDAIVAETLQLDIQVTMGTETGGTPTIPALPTGRHVLYLVKVDDTGVIERRDMVIPAGRLITMASIAGQNNLGYNDHEYLIANDGAVMPLLAAPPGIACDDSVRVLGVTLNHSLEAGSTVEVVQVNLAGSNPSVPFYQLAVSSPLDITGSFTMDGTVRTQTVSFKSMPYYDASALSYALRGPFWGSGSTSQSADPFKTIALRITAANSTTYSEVFAVKWHAIRG